MPVEKDLFAEEQSMVTMSFGDHIEDLRYRLILGIMGLFVGVIITFVPPVFLGRAVMTKMEQPAQDALRRFYADDAQRRYEEAKRVKAEAPPVQIELAADELIGQIREMAPEAKLPDPDTLKDRYIKLTMKSQLDDEIIKQSKTQMERNAVVTLAPLEGITILFMVCTITGLVITSPWVFYQIWAFVAAGLYRHERHYVLKFLPFSLGLFLTGVFLCFFGVLPVTLGFLLELNVWLNIEPSLRLSEWMSFATLLPLVFGICFQTPLVMLFLERVGILTAEDFRSKRKFAILIIITAAAILTPGPDVFSQCMLALPMILLYEVGILIIGKNGRTKRIWDIS
jgi:sec-independent protein translocase protein TatC